MHRRGDTTLLGYSISPEQFRPSFTKITPEQTYVPTSTLGRSLQALQCSHGCGSDQWPLAAGIGGGGALGSRNGGINNAWSRPVISSISTEKAAGPTAD
ncbi:hypothetical protein PBY51_017193 [Eleginops maclovinus]|uniref:Uncharacterized protein n=1 Tax=Eleginops maclovinus TaxID=56733 RepID=A0AAN7XGM1_ELEMC|nr:hypothetical protein PBY51_017193 [Eleginops maclovinus]